MALSAVDDAAPVAGEAAGIAAPEKGRAADSLVPVSGIGVGSDQTAAGEALTYQVLRKRADFLAAAQARRQGTPGFLLQARDRQRGGASDLAGPALRVGFTCSKKVGNAVARNRAKRRLREIARQVLAEAGRPGWDYVLVGRKDETATRDFQQLLNDLRKALAKVHR